MLLILYFCRLIEIYYIKTFEMSDVNMNQNGEFNSINFLLFLWKRKWIIIAISVIAGMASIVFSGPNFIKPKYKSTVVLYPTSTNSISKALLGQNTGMKQDILQFGDEEESEQLLQILNSSIIRSKIIQKYDLMFHYDIDEEGKYPKTQLNREFQSNITFRRTENMAVEIEVMDISPDTAALIANDIADLLDSAKIEMSKSRAIKGYQIVLAEYDMLRAQVYKMEDSMTVLRKLGVHDYESQVEMINRQLAIEISKNPNSKPVKALENKLNLLAQYAGPYVSLRDALEHEKKQLSLIKGKYEESKIDAFEILPQTFRVDQAFPAEKKSYPVRWLIVVLSTFSTFLLVVFSLILIDSIKAATLKQNA